MIDIKDLDHALASNNVDATISSMDKVAISGEVAGANLVEGNPFFDDRNVFSQKFS